MNKILPLLLLTPIASGSMGVFNTPPIPDKPKEISEVVTMTTYTVERSQTDSNPFETASGMILDKKNPAKHRVVAVSRDLKGTFAFGDSILIVAGNYSGIYYVEDVMNKRFKKKIDLLINPKDKHTKLNNVKIVKL
jgi:3D (Asp-Asp-Asp) domain-containing protein